MWINSCNFAIVLRKGPALRLFSSAAAQLFIFESKLTNKLIQ